MLMLLMMLLLLLSLAPLLLLLLQWLLLVRQRVSMQIAYVKTETCVEACIRFHATMTEVCWLA